MSTLTVAINWVTHMHTDTGTGTVHKGKLKHWFMQIQIWTAFFFAIAIFELPCETHIRSMEVKEKVMIKKKNKTNIATQHNTFGT